jgi:pimeloyl-ACP methyl ester carboxylesterase
MCAADGIIYPGYDPSKNRKGNEDQNKNEDIDIILPSAEEQIGAHTTECKKTLVVFIGGAADSLYKPLLNRVFGKYEAQYGRGENRLHDVCYSEHGGDKVVAVIKKWFDAKQKIVLVGHSWGGHRVICLAEENPDITIELLVTLDPVSWSKNGKQAKPKNVKRWLNVYVDYKTASWWRTDNFIARTGGPWQKCQHADVNMIINRDIDGNNIDYGHADAELMFELTRFKDEVIQL